MKIFIFDGSISLDTEIASGIYELNDIQTKELEKFVWKNTIKNLPRGEIKDLNFEIKDEHNGNKMDFFISEGTMGNRNIRLHCELPKLIEKWKLISECDTVIF